MSERKHIWDVGNYVCGVNWTEEYNKALFGNHTVQQHEHYYIVIAEFVEQSPVILCVGVSLQTARNTAEVHILDPRIDRVIIARMTHEYYMDKIVREKTYE